VLVKMLAFTVALAVLPVSAYYLSRDYYFGGQSPATAPAPLCRCSPMMLTAHTAPSFTLSLISPFCASPRSLAADQGTTGAGITAATVANLVLGVFIWVAFQEDGKGVETEESKARKVKKKQ
jgi:hypothetical protein